MKIPESKTNRKKLKVSQLKTILGNLKLSMDGLKPQLLERLEQYVEENTEEQDTEAIEVA